MDYNISCLKHGMPLKMQDLGCNRCHQEALVEIRTRLNVAETFADSAAKQAHRETKREYFNKVKSQAFWDEIVSEDGPEGVEYAKQALACIQGALKKAGASKRVIAVSEKELRQFGCPHCGYRSGSMPVSGGGSGAWICGDCGKQSVVLADGVTKSTIGVGWGGGEAEYPELQVHPRRGIPAHGREDKRPESGEFFRSRGVGVDHCSCFVCGAGPGMMHNIAAYVQCKAAGERVVKMFQKGAWLDFREREPDYIQVKVGACEEHKTALEALHRAVQEGMITSEIIETARRG